MNNNKHLTQKDEKKTGEIVIYQTEDGVAKIDVQFSGETVWLSQEQMAQLFARDKSSISRHIAKIFEDGELDEKVVVANFAIPTQHGAIPGKTQENLVRFYNLDVIISVGYRVKSIQGTRFRQWATEHLREYLVKGFTMNDEVLKNAGGGVYWQELLARIRDIRSSEKVFYRQILDIYATSVDYNPKEKVSKDFFATVQNKMHFAIHQHTAAELIHERVDGNKDFAGLTTWGGGLPHSNDATVAKNYLTKDELTRLSRLTTAFLETAEYMAMQQIPMYMEDWAKELDDMLRRFRHEVLSSKGNISKENADEKAKFEFKKYQRRTLNQPTKGEQDYLESLKQVQKNLESKESNKND